MRRPLLLVVVGVATVAGSLMLLRGPGEQTARAAVSAADAFPSPYVDTKGGISLPADYRLKWAHLGTWSVTDPTTKALSLHDVYAEPDAVAEFQKTGKWKNGACIVKEVRAGLQMDMTTGSVVRDGPIQVWFVMVKDTNKTFPDNPNWGRGWGWALYNAGDPKKNVSTDYKLDCVNCHIPAQQTDWIYQWGYTPLNEKNGPLQSYAKETYQPPAQ